MRLHLRCIVNSYLINSSCCTQFNRPKKHTAQWSVNSAHCWVCVHVCVCVCGTLVLCIILYNQFIANSIVSAWQLVPIGDRPFSKQTTIFSFLISKWIHRNSHYWWLMIHHCQDILAPVDSVHWALAMNSQAHTHAPSKFELFLNCLTWMCEVAGRQIGCQY